VKFLAECEAKAPDDLGKDLFREPATSYSDHRGRKIEFKQWLAAQFCGIAPPGADRQEAAGAICCARGHRNLFFTFAERRASSWRAKAIARLYHLGASARKAHVAIDMDLCLLGWSRQTRSGRALVADPSSTRLRRNARFHLQ
jgi:hypothetical protein